MEELKIRAIIDPYPRNADETTEANVEDNGKEGKQGVKLATSQIQIIQRNKKVQTLEKI